MAAVPALKIPYVSGTRVCVLTLSVGVAHIHAWRVRHVNTKHSSAHVHSIRHFTPTTVHKCNLELVFAATPAHGTDNTRAHTLRARSKVCLVRVTLHCCTSSVR